MSLARDIVFSRIVSLTRPSSIRNELIRFARATSAWSRCDFLSNNSCISVLWRDSVEAFSSSKHCFSFSSAPRSSFSRLKPDSWLKSLTIRDSAKKAPTTIKMTVKSSTQTPRFSFNYHHRIQKCDDCQRKRRESTRLAGAFVAYWHQGHRIAIDYYDE